MQVVNVIVLPFFYTGIHKRIYSDEICSSYSYGVYNTIMFSVEGFSDFENVYNARYTDDVRTVDDDAFSGHSLREMIAVICFEYD